MANAAAGRDIFCLKNVDTFTGTPVRVSKMNAVARAQLIFQMVTLLKKHEWNISIGMPIEETLLLWLSIRWTDFENLMFAWLQRVKLLPVMGQVA